MTNLNSAVPSTTPGTLSTTLEASRNTNLISAALRTTAVTLEATLPQKLRGLLRERLQRLRERLT